VRPRLTRVTVAVLGALLAPACGGERSFEAEEFVSALNEHGAGLELGEPLSSQGPAHEIHAVGLASSATQVHGGGSLAVTENVADAEAEYERCESAASLICYRAANVVLRLEEVSPEQQAQLESAFRELDDG
jgi:hypothetical protein